jgi:hypothetical protein
MAKKSFSKPKKWEFDSSSRKEWVSFGKGLFLFAFYASPGETPYSRIFNKYKE